MHHKLNSSARLLTGWLMVLITINGCASWKPLEPVVYELQEWTSPEGITGVQLLTDHYDMRVTAKDELLRSYLPGFMETTFAKYCELMPPAGNNTDQLVIYLFDNRREWVNFTRIFAPQQAYTYLHIQSGGYTDYPSATAVIFDLGRDRTLSLMAHECFHQYVARYFPEPMPAWLNEGLATQWEAFDLKGDQPIYTPRKNYIRTNNLREALYHGFIPWSEFLGMNAGHAVRKTGKDVRTYYAQVWSLILYLREGSDGMYADRLAVLLADAGTERQSIAIRAYRAATEGSENMSDGEALFRQYITDDFDTFTADYREYVRQLVY
ncbi:MAG: hypothetical protein JSV03_15655 [Planctomycetota bacterium]|nr:MAG: hypothetical protein JSV03_15655 [Planctomycetota bacterium]